MIVLQCATSAKVLVSFCKQRRRVVHRWVQASHSDLIVGSFITASRYWTALSMKCHSVAGKRGYHIWLWDAWIFSWTVLCRNVNPVAHLIQAPITSTGPPVSSAQTDTRLGEYWIQHWKKCCNLHAWEKNNKRVEGKKTIAVSVCDLAGCDNNCCVNNVILESTILLHLICMSWRPVWRT